MPKCVWGTTPQQHRPFVEFHAVRPNSSLGSANDLMMQIDKVRDLAHDGLKTIIRRRIGTQSNHDTALPRELRGSTANLLPP